MGGSGSKFESEQEVKAYEELQDVWIPCPGIGNGNFFPGQTILCKANKCCSTSGQILLETQDPKLRFEGGLEQWHTIKENVRHTENSPQKVFFSITEADDLNVMVPVSPNKQIATSKKRTKKYKMLYEKTGEKSVDIEHFRKLFRDSRLKEDVEGIQGENSFLVVTHVFSVGKMRCESSDRVDKKIGRALQTSRTSTTVKEASQSSDTQIAGYMKCAEVKYDPQTRKITDVKSCDSATFKERYTLVDKKSHEKRYERKDEADIIIAYKVKIESGTKTSANVFLQLVDQDNNRSKRKQFHNNCCRRMAFNQVVDDDNDTDDRAYTFSKVIRVRFKNTCNESNNKGQRVGDLVSKVIVSHDNTGCSPSWFVNKVVLYNLKTGLLQEFPIYRWLSKREDDEEIKRELAMKGVGPGQVRLYKVRIKLADQWNAASGSDSPVIVRLFGSLENSDSVQVRGRLERGEDTEFTIVAPDLGELKRMELSHRGRLGFHNDWMLKKIEVKTEESTIFVQEKPNPAGVWIYVNPQSFDLTPSKQAP